MHLPVIFVILLSVVVSINISSVHCAGSRSKDVESTAPAAQGKRSDSRNRGETKFLLQQPTIKNKKFQVTSPAPPPTPPRRVPVIAGKAEGGSTSRRGAPSKTAPRQPVIKSPPIPPKQQNSIADEILRFPSLASLVYIDQPVVSTTTIPSSTTRRTTPAAARKPPTTQRPRKTTQKALKITEKKAKKFVSDFTCPKPEKIPFQWFPLPCDSHKQCTRSMGKNFRCCEINSNSFKSCTKGIMKQIPEQKHQPIFGVPVKCPKLPLAEIFFQVQTCDTDDDCWPRVCCPDGRKKFCRSPNPEFKEVHNPIARQLMQPYKSATSFIQCTAPSPFDIHPKSCNTTLDCFPNLCCQEGAKRHCRPPQRSLFSRVANTVSQALFGN